MHRPWTRTAVAIAGSIMLLGSESARAQSAPVALLEVARGPLIINPVDHAVDVQRVGVRTPAVAALGIGDAFTLNAGDADAIQGIVEGRRRCADGLVLEGMLLDDAHGRFVIVMVDDAVAGYFFLGGGAGRSPGTLRLRYGGPDGVHYIHRLDSTRFQPCLTGGAAPKRDRDPAWIIEDMLGLAGVTLNEPRDALATTGPEPGPNIGASAPAMSSGACGPVDPTFDLMIVYTDDMRIAFGGTAAMVAECILAAEVTQLTYDSCSLVVRTNLVFVGEVAYTETGDLDTDLTSLIDPSDGMLDGVHDTRDGVSADFAVLLVNDGGGGGGLGTCMADPDDAFSVVRGWQAVDALTLPHEVGHNIGLAHNPEDADCAPTDSGYGHNFYVPELEERVRTVMAYEVVSGEERIPFYSNPDCSYHGVPTGTSTRDNLSVIHWRRPECESFRLTRMDSWTDFAYSGTEWGSYSQPYDTVAESIARLLESPVTGTPVLHIHAGSTPETLTISKRMVIEACGGPVRIGD